MTGEAEHRLSLHTELTAARDTLASAGVDVGADGDGRFALAVEIPVTP